MMRRSEDFETQAEQAHVWLMGGRIHRPSIMLEMSATLLALFLE